MDIVSTAVSGKHGCTPPLADGPANNDLTATGPGSTLIAVTHSRPIAIQSEYRLLHLK